MKKRLFIGTNTKMYKNRGDTLSYLQQLGVLTAKLDRERLCLFVIPSFTALDAAYPIARDKNILLGAQNVAWEDEGQFTGEISAPMLRELGVSIAEIGHSERRNIFGETSEMTGKKVQAALRHHMTALFCIGERSEEKDAGQADHVLRSQLTIGLAGLTQQQCSQLWIAYEPVWAIGTRGIPASPIYAAEKHQVIYDCLVSLFGEGTAKKIPILYGGSVNPENAPQLITMPHIDGLFVGRSAWVANAFSTMIHTVLPLFEEKG